MRWPVHTCDLSFFKADLVKGQRVRCEHVYIPWPLCTHVTFFLRRTWLKVTVYVVNMCTFLDLCAHMYPFFLSFLRRTWWKVSVYVVNTCSNIPWPVYTSDLLSFFFKADLVKGHRIRFEHVYTFLDLWVCTHVTFLFLVQSCAKIEPRRFFIRALIATLYSACASKFDTRHGPKNFSVFKRLCLRPLLTDRWAIRCAEKMRQNNCE
jgi:hypothetical protein